MFEGIGTELVWDGAGDVRIPERMGTPREGQMEGTKAEQLTELAGRVCYDSLGSKTSRSSADYIKHVLSVGHLSIAEHYNAVVYLEGGADLTAVVALVALNRPWIWVTPLGTDKVRICANLRVVMEWNKWTSVLNELMPDYSVETASHLGAILRHEFHELAPRLIKEPHPAEVSMAQQQLDISEAMLVDPETDAEKWITVFTYGSRGYSHELVRHGDFTGISQRSTRFCNESKSPWVLHPLIQQYMAEADPVKAMLRQKELSGLIEQARSLYKDWVKRLIPVIKDRLSPDDPYRTTTARKQARGAARGLLGNALEMEMIFSASVLEWRHIFGMRAAAAADGEIRVAMCRALEACKGSRYGDRFENMGLVEASDGTGSMLAGGGAA